MYIMITYISACNDIYDISYSNFVAIFQLDKDQRPNMLMRVCHVVTTCSDVILDHL